MSFTPVENPIYTYKLLKPIKVYGEDLNEISIREPTLADQVKAGGSPFFVKNLIEIDIDINDAKAMKLLSILSNIPIPGMLETLAPYDALACFYDGLLPFFCPGLRPTKNSEADI